MAEKPDTAGLGDEQLEKDLAEAESQEETEKPQAEEESGAAPEGEQGEGTTDEESEAGEDTEESGYEDTDEPDIPTRNASHIIRRQRKTIEKLRSKEQEEPEVSEEPEESDIDRAIERKLSPVLDTIAEEQTERDLQRLLDNEPEAAKYQKSIRAFMKHPSWSQVPAEAIFHHLHFKNAQSEGAKRSQNADKEAAQSGSGPGSTRRPGNVKEGNFPSEDEIAEMSDADLEKLQNRILQGEFTEE